MNITLPTGAIRTFEGKLAKLEGRIGALEGRIGALEDLIRHPRPPAPSPLAQPIPPPAAPQVPSVPKIEYTTEQKYAIVGEIEQTPQEERRALYERYGINAQHYRNWREQRQRDEGV